MMAPILRDTLVGFNYAYYAPPGAQILITNPLFVRSHDFVGMQGSSPHLARHRTVRHRLAGECRRPAGGLARTLPYALAEAEQNFLVPTQTQALIWGDLVPQMILSAKIPRWWNVTPAQVHWVGLHLRYGRDCWREAALDTDVRKEVLDALALHAAPARTALVSRLVEEGDVKEPRSTSLLPSCFRSPAIWLPDGAPIPRASCAEMRQLAARLAQADQLRRPSPGPSALPNRRSPTPTSRNCSTSAPSPP